MTSNNGRSKVLIKQKNVPVKFINYVIIIAVSTWDNFKYKMETILMFFFYLFVHKPATKIRTRQIWKLEIHIRRHLNSDTNYLFRSILLFLIFRIILMAFLNCFSSSCRCPLFICIIFCMYWFPKRFLSSVLCLTYWLTVFCVRFQPIKSRFLLIKSCPIEKYPVWKIADAPERRRNKKIILW